MDKNGMMKEGHNIICETYYDCFYCKKEPLGINNYIDFTDDFTFDKNNNIIVKYCNNFYHYNCLYEFIGKNFIC